MSKKILMISSSPRKNANSDILCNAFAQGAEDSGHSVEKIRLAEQKIEYCRGCMACSATGKCVIKDDMEALLAKMVQADVIVLASPVYFYSMAAQMKTFIDRMVPQYTAVSDKSFYLILTAADTDRHAFDETTAGFRGFFRCLDGAKEAGIIRGFGLTNAGEAEKAAVRQQAYEAGLNA